MTHWDLRTSAFDEAQRFYTDVFGWRFESVDVADGVRFARAWCEEAVVAGLLSDGDVGWMPYVPVDDLDAAVQRARQRGGTVLLAPVDVPGLGRRAVVQSPRGSLTGLASTGVFSGGALLVREPGRERSFWSTTLGLQVDVREGHGCWAMPLGSQRASHARQAGARVEGELLVGPCGGWLVP